MPTTIGEAHLTELKSIANPVINHLTGLKYYGDGGRELSRDSLTHLQSQVKQLKECINEILLADDKDDSI